MAKPRPMKYALPGEAFEAQFPNQDQYHGHADEPSKDVVRDYKPGKPIDLRKTFGAMNAKKGRD